MSFRETDYYRSLTALAGGHAPFELQNIIRKNATNKVMRNISEFFSVDFSIL